MFSPTRYSINNLGDPFVESNYGVHSRTFEVDVLNFFADLWRIPRDEYVSLSRSVYFWQCQSSHIAPSLPFSL